MADVERLGDVGRAEVDADDLIVGGRLAIGCGIGLDRGQHLTRHRRAPELEVDERSGRDRRFDHVVGLDLLRQF